MKKWITFILTICLAVSLFTACGEKQEAPEKTASPKATASVTAKTTESAKATPETTPTVVPTKAPDADPEVDAMLFRFWSEEEYGWENITNAADETGLPEYALKVAAELEFEEDAGLKITVQSGDPYFLIVPASDTGETFSLEEYPVLKIRIKNESPSTTGEFFIARNGQNNVAAGDEIQYDITANDTEFKEYIVNLKELKGESFVSAGDVSALRVDTVKLTSAKNPTAEEAFSDAEPFVVYIDYFGFFKTVADAEAWNPAHVAK